MLCDIEDAALKSALEKLKATNADVDGVRADVSLKGELVSAAEATIARYDKVHILVNNAGVGGGGPYGMSITTSENRPVENSAFSERSAAAASYCCPSLSCR